MLAGSAQTWEETSRYKTRAAKSGDRGALSSSWSIIVIVIVIAIVIAIVIVIIHSVVVMLLSSASPKHPPPLSHRPSWTRNENIITNHPKAVWHDDAYDERRPDLPIILSLLLSDGLPGLVMTS